MNRLSVSWEYLAGSCIELHAAITTRGMHSPSSVELQVYSLTIPPITLVLRAGTDTLILDPIWQRATRAHFVEKGPPSNGMLPLSLDELRDRDALLFGQTMQRTPFLASYNVTSESRT